MKYCMNCGYKINEGKKFCIKCGKQITYETEKENVEEQPKPRKKWPWILGGISIGIFIISILLCCFYFSDVEVLKRNMEAEEWEQASQTYNRMVGKENELKGDDVIWEYVKKIEGEYINHEKSYEEAILRLQNLESINSGADIENIIVSIQELEIYRKTYEEAEAYWKQNEYESAMLKYQEIIECYAEDKHMDLEYDASLLRMEEGKNIYKQELLDEVEGLMNAQEYSNAIIRITAAQQILKDDSELNALLQKAQKEKLSDSLTEFINEEKYEEALEVLKDCEELLETDSSIRAQKQEIEQKYREVLLEKAHVMYLENGYESSVSVLRQGLQSLPKDETIEREIERYKSCKPVKIEELKVLETEIPTIVNLDNCYFSGEVEDLYGNKYQGYFQFLYLSDPEYIEFYTAEQYTNVRGTVFVGKFTDKDYTGKLEIYADDVLVYSSGEISRDTKAVNFDVSINSAERLRLEVSSGRVITLYLTDVFVYNSLR